MELVQLNFYLSFGRVKKEKFRIHIEIGTGMGRTGINPKRIREFLEEAKKYPNIKIEGIYTHFSCSDTDEEYTRKQIKSFKEAVEIVQEEIKDLKYIHCSNSAGILNFKEAHFNLVRPRSYSIWILSR